MTKREIQVGDRVAYSVKFLRSIGAQTGDLAFFRGTVRAVTLMHPRGATIAAVDWDDGDAPESVNVKNLAVVGSREFREEV